MERVIKLVLAIMLLFCLLQMPYGYYSLLRFACFAGFGFLAYLAKKKDNDTEMFIFGALALLFQPFFKIALGRALWNIVDIIVSISLIYSILNHKEPKEK
ncbi:MULTISPECIES: DUF6804 family protein [Myroides]|uniref:DUF6804 family protein n=1 Tax=Myroides TaxID=76831 RepID=UPI0013247891|nr:MULTISPECIES: DUF6804 family protein [Myroides]MVX35182.1 hypothetical protein [Myroides sp. LoEW2-1]UVD78927.1 hypothetical protein NWE55_12455 [Myroides albus]